MTISSEVNRSGPYLGNGVSRNFAFGFKISDPSHVKVVRLKETGTEIVLTLDADYTVIGGNPTGTVRLNDPLKVDNTLTLILDVPFTQEIDLENQGAFYAETVERGLDLAVQRDLTLAEAISRTPQIPVSADPSVLPGLVDGITRLYASADNIDTVADNIGIVSEVAANMDNISVIADTARNLSAIAEDVEANAVIAQNAADRAEDAADEAAQSVASVTPTVLRFSGTGAQTTFNLGIANLDEKLTNVFVGGVYRQKDTYDVINGVLTFAVAPASGTNNIEVNIGGTTAQAYAIPSNGTVTKAKLSAELANELASLEAFSGMPAGFADAGSLTQQSAAVVEGIFQNMLQEYPTYSGDLAPNYSMRTVEWRRPVGSATNAPATRIVSPDRPYSASSMGHVLRFFARAAQVWPDKRTTLYPIIQKLARMVRALQVENPRLARYGGFASGADNGQCSVYNAAQCGLGMLEVYRLTDDANYLASAKLAGEFIKRLRPTQVNAFYSANYGVTPVPQINYNGFNTFGVWLTAVDSDDTLRRQITLWDALALKFFHELAIATGDTTWDTIQTAAQPFFAYGLANGFEVFSIYDTASRTMCNDTWYLDNNIDATVARDHRWHRRGETVLATPLGGGAAVPVNTIGTDQIEYSIEGLYDAGYDPILIDQYYLQYRNAVTVKGGATQSSTVATYAGLFYNPGLCFSGYVRWDTALYLASTDPNMPAGTTARRNVQFGDHYDIQGVGPLLRYKYERHPADFAASMQAALLAGGTMSTFLNADLSYRWSTTDDFEFLTYGIGNVIGTIGLGLIEVIASLGE